MAADAPGPFLSLTAEDLLGPLNDVEEKYAPARLYIAGDRRLLSSGPRVSVIGSRGASAEGVRNARLITESLVDHSVVVVSGLAGGIDTVAHETAIRCGGLWAVPLVYLPAVGRVGWCVDLNTATREELQLIIHVGPSRADAIIAGRPWRSVDELRRVSGISEARLAEIKQEGLACVRGGG